MSILGGLTTDYGEDTGAFIISSMITKGIYAINDVNEFYNPIDLQLGTNGSINLIVGSDNNLDKPERCISIIDNYKEQTGIYNFQVYGSNAIALSPADTNTTVYVGDAVFYSDTDYVYLTSYTKKLALVTEEIELGGSLHSLQDLKIEGEMYTGEVNITYPVTEDDLLGYAFKINPDNHTLELVKYFSASNPDDSVAQLVASFGQGDIINDPNYSFNTYNATGTTPITEFETTDPSSGSGSGGGGGGGYWFANGNDIHFGNYGGTAQRVGINTETPSSELDVIGTIKGTQLTDGHVNIANGYLTNLKSIEVETSGPYNGIVFKDLRGPGINHYWDGDASNVHNIDQLPLSSFVKDMDISDFYTGTGVVWFDDISSNIRLSTFCNDILDFGGDVTFCNCTVTEVLTANESVLETLTASNVIMSNLSAIDAGVSNLTIGTSVDVPNITTDSINVSKSISVNETVSTSNINVNTMTVNNDMSVASLNVTSALDANTITALINKIVSDEINTRLATISGTLSVANLATSNVVTSLLPDANEVYDLGSAEHKWRDLYLSGNSLHLDEVVMRASGDSSARTLNFENAAISMDTIEFRDGTTLSSINEIVSSVNEGEVFGDFSDISVTINTVRNQVEVMSGSYVYNYLHNIAEHGNRWKVVEFENDISVLPIQSDGSGVNVDAGSLVKRGGLPKNIQLSFVQRSKILGQNLFLTQDTNKNINELFPVRNYDPMSRFFKNKCKVDFHYYHNLREIEYDFKATTKTLYFDKTNSQDYVQINSIENFNQKNSGTKFYDIELLYFFSAPLYDVKYMVDGMTNKYLVSNDDKTRLDKAYVFDDVSQSYVLDTINDEYGLYPRITIQKWDNSANTTEFSEVVYNTSVGWGVDAPDIDVVFDKFKNNGWLFKLFELTCYYIRYGNVIDDYSDDFDVDIQTVFDTLTSADITFVNENALIDIDGTSIENNTTVCFKKGAFDFLFPVMDTVNFDFSQYSETSTSYVDVYNNTITHNNKLHEISADGSLATVHDLMELYMTPNDWSSFANMGNNFRMKFRINMSHTNNVYSVNDKFIAHFVHPMYGSLHERGFDIHLFQNNLTFKGYVRYEDGNSRDMLFNTTYNVQYIPSFYDTVRDWEFEFTTFDIGSDSINTNAWGLAKIKIDGVVRSSVYVTDVNNYTTQTQRDGVFLYTSGEDNGYYLIKMHMGTSELYNFEMGRLN
jgi:hypothetical protein